MRGPQRIHDPATVYEYIVAYKRRHDGNSPTVREIGAACGVPSTAHVCYILRALEQDGLIRISPGPRRIVVVGGQWCAPPGDDGG